MKKENNVFKGILIIILLSILPLIALFMPVVLAITSQELTILFYLILSIPLSVMLFVVEAIFIIILRKCD